jgi:hypothetical protein
LRRVARTARAVLRQVQEAIENLTERLDSTELMLQASGGDQGMIYMTMSGLQEELAAIRQLLERIDRRL